MRRLVDVVSMLIAWPLVAVVWAVDMVAGRLVDARLTRFANRTDDE